jgi:glycosyltransferase involved in cell wall biosynthesis
VIPSGGFGLPPRRHRLLALLAVRDQIGHLPGYLASVGPQVDGVIALDDGSSDGSAEFLASRAEILELLRVPRDRPRWDEIGNHRALIAAALRHGAEWLLSLDADERVEREFRARAERVIRRGSIFGLSAYALRLRELWDDTRYYRADGIWGRKRVARLFRALPDHGFDTRPLHGLKAPLQARIGNRYPVTDVTIYHLAMLRKEDRVARRRRYEALDPDARWQPDVGYAYLTDEIGLKLRRVPPGRHYAE